MDIETERKLVPAKFLIDADTSRFTVQAFATGLLSSFGHNPTIGIRDYVAEIEVVRETYKNAKIRVTVQTRGMEVLDDMKNDDRKKLEQEMYDSVLAINRFPTAIFDSTVITVQKLSDYMLTADVTGDLSFHGVTRSHSFGARVTILGTMLRISGEFSLRQSDYGIKPFKFAGGALRLKDDLKFKFELVARQQK